MNTRTGPLDIRREEGCWTLTLDRPEKANALSTELVEALIAAVAEAERAGVAVLAFRGQGRNFSAGFDFDGFEASTEADLVQRFVRIETLLQAVDASPCLTLAFAQGRNFGAGADLFAACRWRVAAPQASFRMPGLAFGTVLGTRRFAAIVGRDNAHDLLERLETFDAERGRELGFVRRIVPVEQWEDVAAEAVGVCRLLPPASRVALRRALAGSGGEADMAELVRSVSVPGLKERIGEYLVVKKRP